MTAEMKTPNCRVPLWEAVTFAFFFFFFSSRRRHTRLQGDWSSDVCSSDLAQEGEQALLVIQAAQRDLDGAQAQVDHLGLERIELHGQRVVGDGADGGVDHVQQGDAGDVGQALGRQRAQLLYAQVHAQGRSEEHTSEPQSPCNLVCRLLLEKKKNNTT